MAFMGAISELSEFSSVGTGSGDPGDSRSKRATSRV